MGKYEEKIKHKEYKDEIDKESASALFNLGDLSRSVSSMQTQYIKV